MAVKKGLSFAAGYIYDSQATNKKQGGLTVRAPLPMLHSYRLSGSHK
jgi:hypothetical protein